MKITCFLFLLVLLYSCQRRSKASSPLPSPSGNYSIQTFTNKTSSTQENYGVVFIALYTSEGKKLSELNTHASDFSKWQAGWDQFNDTIILNSKDIGIFAWRIEQNDFKEVFASEAIQNRAAEIFTAE